MEGKKVRRETVPSDDDRSDNDDGCDGANEDDEDVEVADDAEFAECQPKFDFTHGTHMNVIVDFSLGSNFTSIVPI